MTLANMLPPSIGCFQEPLLSSTSTAQQLSLTEVHSRGNPVKAAADAVEPAKLVDQPPPVSKSFELSSATRAEDFGREEFASDGHLMKMASALEDAEPPAVQRESTVPGSNASPLRIHSLWSQLPRWMLSSGTKFSGFLRAMLTQPREVKKKPNHLTACPWPMPLPYPMKGRANSKEEEKILAFRKSLNLQVAWLNFLFLRKSSKPPSSICGRQLLTADQWEVIDRLAKLGQAWKEHELIEAHAMGRVAAKQERQEQVLAELERFAVPVVSGLQKYQRLSRVVSDEKDDSLVGGKLGALRKGDLTGLNRL